MRMDEGLDTGPVHVVRPTAIDPHETSGALFDRLARLGADALDAFLERFPDVPPPEPQAEDGVTLAPPLRKEEGQTDFDRQAREVVDHLRGMDPWPGAFTTRAGASLKLYGGRISPRSQAPGLPPGTVLGVDAGGLHVACRAGAVQIAEVQPAGGKRMAAQAYATGRPFGDAERMGA
jgi:methionyl-tRNA formyltransferase